MRGSFLLLCLAWFLAAPAGGEASRSQAELDFSAGLDAFEQGRLEEAMARFESALERRPEHGSARYWLGVTLLVTGEPERAARELERGLKAVWPPRTDRWRVLGHLGEARLAAGDARGAARALEEALDLAPEVPALLELHSRASRAPGPELADPETTVPSLPALYRGPFWPPPSPSRWEGRLGVAVGRDSNPNLLDDGLALATLDGEIVRGAQQDQLTTASLRLASYPFDDRRGWSLGLTLQGEQSLHQDVDFLDLGEARAAVHLAWGRDPLSRLGGPLGHTRVPYGSSVVSLLLQAGYHTSRLGGDAYARGVEAAVALTVREAGFTATQLELVYLDLDYEESRFQNPGRGGSLTAVELGQIFYLGKRHRHLRLALASGERDAGVVYARSFTAARAELALPLASGWSVRLRASLRRDDYDHPESNLFSLFPGPEPREDTTVRAAAEVAWAFHPRLQAVVTLSRETRDAELELPLGIPGLDYDRSGSSLGFRWRL